MHNGALQCYGSTLFLKKHYGTGYVLSVLVESEWDIDKITDLIKSHVPTVATKSFTGNCITFALPTNDTTALSTLFINLEKNKTELNITNFGVSITTMEEVFLKVGEIADEVDKGSSRHEEESKHLLADSYSTHHSEGQIEAPFLLLKQQFKGLILKRVRYTVRKWITFLLSVCIPLCLILIAFALMRAQNTTDPRDKNVDIRFNLQLEKYPQSKVYYSNSRTKETQNLGDIYTSLIKKQQSAVVNVLNVSEAVIAIGKNNMDDYERSLIVSAEFGSAGGQINLNAMYGSLALHGLPISLNLLSNSLLEYVKPNAYFINVTNNPIPYETDVMTRNIMGSLEKALNWMFLIPLAFTIMFGLFIIFPQEERMSGVLHLQCMAGVSKFTYWISNFMFDLALYLSLSFITIILLLSFDHGGSFGNVESIGKIALIINTWRLKGSDVQINKQVI